MQVLIQNKDPERFQKHRTKKQQQRGVDKRAERVHKDDGAELDPEPDRGAGEQRVRVPGGGDAVQFTRMIV